MLENIEEMLQGIGIGQDFLAEAQATQAIKVTNR